MSVEENLRVIEAAQKALNDRDLDRFETLHLNSVVQRDPQNPQGIKGPKAIRASLGPFLKAFPDIRLVTWRFPGPRRSPRRTSPSDCRSP